ncbi:hypothetical protein [Nocardioides sp. cx-173]|uniref:hypothetical protein n=1 Tax=Nocardioides sp. cx-173 TaxID=2898796 RepID=UPI001E5176CF|nr:hypothetical protein [Nocardioides sp. cx-173]MCD4525229.1 hypothetical protein [Nocardioides sp. cx-173]UGB40968.1 hypothetical protein LQ940_16520 [Nocardioides sp. cx-173]
MTGFQFVVPKLLGSPWDHEHLPRRSTDPDWPRVGIYCAHEPWPWLVGSFAVSDEVQDQRGTEYWGWDLNYLTGDGFLIPLTPQAKEKNSHFLVGDQVRDREAERRDLQAAAAAVAAGDFEAARRVNDRIAMDRSQTRERIPMLCGHCDYRRVFRSETVQKVASTFWRIGHREVDLRTFAARVDRAA